jgi:hypothetical protein
MLGALGSVLAYVENDSPVPDTSLELALVIGLGVLLLVAGLVAIVLLTRRPRTPDESSMVDDPPEHRS